MLEHLANRSPRSRSIVGASATVAMRPTGGNSVKVLVGCVRSSVSESDEEHALTPLWHPKVSGVEASDEHPVLNAGRWVSKPLYQVHQILAMRVGQQTWDVLEDECLRPDDAKHLRQPAEKIPVVRSAASVTRPRPRLTRRPTGKNTHSAGKACEVE